MALPPPTPLRDLELVSPVVLPPQRRSRLAPGSANPPAAVFLLGSGARQPALVDHRRRPVVLEASRREGSLGGLLRDSQDVEVRLEDRVSLVYWHKVLLMANSSKLGLLRRRDSLLKALHVRSFLPFMDLADWPLQRALFNRRRDSSLRAKVEGSPRRGLGDGDAIMLAG
jgi:hypothetical protein